MQKHWLIIKKQFNIMEYHLNNKKKVNYVNFSNYQRLPVQSTFVYIHGNHRNLHRYLDLHFCCNASQNPLDTFGTIYF